MPNDDQLPSPWLVSTEWLADHLTAPDVVVVDGSFYLPGSNRDARAEYLAAHIPGAVFFDIDEIADHTTDLPHMLPRPEAFSSAMRALGIGDGETIVVYDGAGLFGAPRVWWTFRTFGVREVYLLDGGLPKWKTEGRPIESGEVKRLPRHFSARFDNGAVAAVGDVQRALATGGAQVVDARSPERFRGEAPEPRPGVRSGRMPGSLNVPASRLLKDGRLAPREQLAAAFEAGGVDVTKPIITSCGSGVSATTLALALEALGNRQVRVYDGSWTEWGSREDLPVATGP
jgi:thiosulfate/3-mercaptopyruvate sulfurtransferase